MQNAQPSAPVSSLAGAPPPADPVAEIFQLYGQGRHQEVINRAGPALRAAPDNVDLWHIGAASACALGLLEDAERFWTVVVTRKPDHAEAHYDLGALYLERGQHTDAARHLSRALALDPTHSWAMHALGLVNLNMGHIDQARSCFDAAIRLDPRIASARANRAKICLLDGDKAGAEQNVAAALAIDPGNCTAHLIRAEQGKTRISPKWVKQLRTAYRARRSRPIPEHIGLCFAMGKLAEKLKDYELAFEAYTEGNRLHYERNPWNEDGADGLLAQAMASIDPGVYEHAARIDVGCPSEDRVPIFIVGMPRSGTTLLEQILACHPQVHGCGELTTLGDLLRSGQLDTAGDRTTWLRGLRAVGQRYLDAVWTSDVRTRFAVDKMPGNYEVVGWMPLTMPQARIIHIRRDPLDTCLSCFATLFSTGHQYAFDQTALARQYGRYRRWMAHWHAVMPPGAILEIDYERLVADLEGVTRSVLAHIGLDWHPDCLRFHRNNRPVLTASRSQVSKPLYSSSIGRWRRFERHLAPLRTALAPHLPESVS